MIESFPPVTRHSALMAVSRWCALGALFFSPWYLQWVLGLPGLNSATVPAADNLPKLRPADLFAILSIGSYTLGGWPGLKKMWTSTARVWLLSLIGLAGMGVLSITWAAQRELAAVFAIHAGLWIIFAIRVAADDLKPVSIASSLFAGLLVNSLVGLSQFAVQHSLGLSAFGELVLDPKVYGVSVIGDESLRILRVYGLSGHPNVLGGFATVALLWSVGLMLQVSRRNLPIMLLAWLLGWLTLLLTFSRSAWLGMALGLSLIAVLRLRRRWVAAYQRRLIALSAMVLIPIVWLAMTFGPSLSQRLSLAPSALESLSIWDRLDLIDAAASMIAKQPLTGVGIGNFEVVNHNMSGVATAPGWVHNVPLLIASELGLPGLVIWLISIGSIARVVIRGNRQGALDRWQIVAAGSIAAMLAVMLFDHYMWTSSQGVYVWAAISGWVMSREFIQPPESN